MDENDKLSIAAAVAAGAAIGGVAGFLFFSDTGRRALRALRPALDEIARELSGVSESLNGVTGAALTGWKLFDEFVNEIGAGNVRSSMTH